jgi:integrase
MVTLEKGARYFLAEQLALRQAKSPDALAPSTITLYEKILRGLMQDHAELRLDTMLVSQVERIRLKLFQRGSSLSYVRAHTDVLSSICRNLWRQGLIDTNPMDIWKLRSRPIRTKTRSAAEAREIDAIANRDSILALVKECQRDNHCDSGWKIEGIVLLAVGSGLRLGEIRGLRWASIKHPTTPSEFRTIAVVESWPTNGREGELTKTGKPRAVLYPTIFGEWYERNRHRGMMQDLVFSKTRGEDLLRALGRRCVRAGFSHPATFQVLRHTFASHMLTLGYPLEWVSDQLGNSPEVARRHYAKYLDPWRRPEPVPAGMNPTDLIFCGGA